MATRNILDSNGNIIGALTLPDSTTEEEWTVVLNQYAQPPALTQEEIVTAKINSAIEFGNYMMIKAATENVLLGITQAGKTKAVADYLVNLQNYLRTGSLYAAIDELNRLIADTGRPDGLDPWVTNERLEEYKTQIITYLGI